MKIRMSSPDITAAEIAAVTEVLQTPDLSQGPRVAEFERAFAASLGSAHAVAVSSGTAGLHLCVVAGGVQDGDLVVTSPFSFVASANVVLYERAVPVFVDIDPTTYNIDPTLAAQAVEDLARDRRPQRWLPPRVRGAGPSGRRRLRAILPVHTFGWPAAMPDLCDLARRFALTVIEDACEAVGAECAGRPVGRWGDAGVFAFYPNKQMTTAEGGIIVTERADWAGLLRSLRNQGRDDQETWLRHVRLGFNYRMDDLRAALGLAQLRRLPDLLARRDQVASWYGTRLRSLEGVDPPVSPARDRRTWFVYVIRLASWIDRDAVMRELHARGIPTRPYFVPIHLQPFYRERFGYGEGDFPVTEAVARSTLALPFSSTMTEPQVEAVCQTLRAVLPHAALRR